MVWETGPGAGEEGMGPDPSHPWDTRNGAAQGQREIRSAQKASLQTQDDLLDLVHRPAILRGEVAALDGHTTDSLGCIYRLGNTEYSYDN